MFDLSQFNKYKEDNRREVKKAQGGVPDIYSVWENQGWAAPEVIEEYAPDRTILKLSFVNVGVKEATEKSDRKKVTEKTEKKMEQIFSQMQPNVEYKVEEAAEWLSVGRTRARILLKMSCKKLPKVP